MGNRTPYSSFGRVMRRNSFCTGSRTIYFRIMKYLLLVFATSFSILLIVYMCLTRNIERQTCQKNLDIVKNGAENMEEILSSQEKLAIFYEYNESILDFYLRANPLTEGSTTSDILVAQKILSAMGIANSDILNTQMYAERSGAIIDYSVSVLFPDRYYGGKFFLNDYDCAKWIDEVLLESKKQTFMEAEMYFQGYTRSVLIYNRKFSCAGSDKGNNRIIFYTDGQKLKSVFSAAKYDGGFLAVLDKDGKVILSDCLTESNKQSLTDISLMDEGYYRRRIDGRNMLMVSHQSDTLGFTYILAVPYSDVLSDVKPLTRTMGWLVILAGLVGTLFVMGMSAHFSKFLVKVQRMLGTSEACVSLEDFAERLAQLVKGNERMKEEMDRQLEILQYESFKNVVTGSVTEEKEIRAAIRQNGIKADAEHYVFLILCWNDLDDINMEEISAQKVYMESLVLSMDRGEVEIVFQLDLEHTVVILSYDKCSLQESRNRADSLVTHIMEESVKNINYSISVAGDIISRLELLSKGFFHAKKALSVSSNIFGNSPIQWYDMAKVYFRTMPQEEEPDSTHNVRLVEEIKKYIEEHYSDSDLSLVSIAQVFFITEAYVSKLFKRISGQNFSKYIEKIRMENARSLLDEGRTITEVSALVGYNSPQAFRRAWKRYYGGVPSERQG